MGTGKVFLVGAGPGDIGLITVKGLAAIKGAEVILYDRLANPKLLEYASSDCEFIYCGKLPDRHVLRQEQINSLLVEKALEGKTVVRLKGGDPGVFGRVGEEAAALAEYGISFEIVPGISSGIAAPLYAGIPVTHREHAESFAVVTAHDKSEDGRPLLDWEGLARGVDTIAFYMGVGNLPFICEKLIQHGKPSGTPVILIQWGTFGRQQTLQGTLETIAEKVEAAKFSNPSIILVGEVISIRDKISWFEKKRLNGRQMILARTSDTPSEMAKALMDQGADVIEFPRWRRTKLSIDVEKAVVSDKILFAQPESVDEFFDAVFQKGIDIREIKADFFGGSVKTVKELNKRGFGAELVSETGDLFVIGDNHAANADLVTAQKEVDQSFMPILKRMLEEAKVDTVIIPCRAAVEPFLKGLQDCGVAAESFLRPIQLVCFGEKTKLELERNGFVKVKIMSKEALLGQDVGI